MSLKRALAVWPFILVLTVGTAVGQDASPGPSPGADESPDGSVASPDTSPDGEVIEVRGIEYAFESLPPIVTPGSTFQLVNVGQEVHELLIVRRSEDMTPAIGELIGMSEEEMSSVVAIVGEIHAGPGETSEDTVAVTEEGEYFAICLVPQGTTEMTEEGGHAEASPAMSPTDGGTDASPAVSPESGEPSGEGPPHALLGMWVEFTVTDEGEASAGATPVNGTGAESASPQASPA